MATVFDYLNKLKQENPEYRKYTSRALYKELKGKDKNLPIWKEIDIPSKSSYNKNEDPGFLNGLFDWTDYGINETSSGFAKAAYNNSITGLAYQLHNGEERFDLSEYNPGVVEDIFSAVLSFSMPLDIASMFVGGFLGKTVSSIASQGIKQNAIKNLTGKAAFTGKFGKQATAARTKAALKKAGVKLTPTEAREKFAKEYVEALIEKGGYGTLYNPSQAIKFGAVNQGITLATFEGVRGGVQAAVDGEDIWKGIGHGVAHGGVMGALTGALGASMNIKHGKLFNKFEKGEDLSKIQKAQMRATGKVGQVVAEAGLFTLPDAYHVMTDENYGMNDMFRNFIVNSGMMGVLKAKHKLWDKGKQELGRWASEEGAADYKRAQDLKKSLENTKEQIRNMPEDTPALKKVKKKLEKDLDLFVKRQLKNADADIEFFETWEVKFKEATDFINSLEKHNIMPPEKLLSEYQNVLTMIQAISGSMNSNKTRGGLLEKINSKAQKNSKKALEDRNAFIEGVEAKERQWKEEIVDRIQNLDKTGSSLKTFKGGKGKVAEETIQLQYNQALQEAINLAKKGDTTPLEVLTKGVKGYDKKTQKIDLDKANTGVLEKKFESYMEAKNALQKTKKKTAKAPKTKKDDFIAKEGDITKNIKEAREEELNLASDPNIGTGELKKQEKLQRSNINAQGETFKSNLGETRQTQKDAFNESKAVINSMAKNKSFQKSSDPGGKINLAKDFAHFLAEKGKSLLDINDAYISEYMAKISKKGKNSATQFASMSRLIQHLGTLRNEYGRDILKNFKEFDLVKETNIGKALKIHISEHMKSITDVGFRVPGSKYSNTKIANGEITLFGKGVEMLKLTSKSLTDKLKKVVKYSLNLRGESPPGHKDFTFKTIDGLALTTAEVNWLTKNFFKGKVDIKGLSGEGRLFRKSIEEWVASKEGKVDRYDLYEFAVDKLMVGHKGINVAEMYQKGGFKNPRQAKQFVDKVLKEYWSDIREGKFDANFGIAEGYTPKEIRAGLKEIEKQFGKKKEIEIDYIGIDGKVSKKKVTKETVDTMFQYMIETGPRLNEIAPSKDLLKGYVDRAQKLIDNKIYKEEFQLEKELSSADKIVSAKELAYQVEWVKKKFPKLTVAVEKTLGKHNGRYVLGKIQNHLIKIAENRAKIDTLPHEVAHHVVDVLKEIGDPRTRKIVKDGIKMFKGEEAFVDAIGKYTAKQLPKGKIGRMKSWVKRAVSYLRNYFGIRDKSDADGIRKDIVRMIGGKVLTGKIPTDYVSLKSKLKTKYQQSNTVVGKRIVKKFRKSVEDAEVRAKQDFNLSDNQIREIREDVLEGRSLKDKNNTAGDLERLQRRYEVLFTENVQGKSLKEAINISKVTEMEQQYDISKATRDAYFDRFKVKFEDATPKMLKSYKSHIAMGDKIIPMQNTVAEAFNAIALGKSADSISIWKRAFMKASDVIGEFGPAGKKIAEKLERHDFTRSVILKGPGEVNVTEIKRIVKDKNVQKNYMHMIDPVLAKNAIKQLERLSKKSPKYMKEYKEALIAKKAFEVGGKYEKAAELWKDTSNFYWNQLKIAIGKNSKSNTELKTIIDNLNKKFIQEYFVRRPRKEVMEFLNRDFSSFDKLVREVERGLTKKDLAKIKSEGSTPKEAIAIEIMNMIKFGPTKASPRYLKSRSVTLPEYVEITTKKGRKKLVKSYESDVDATMSSYVNGMSKFISTVTHFPEMTQLGGKFSLYNKSAEKIVEIMEKTGNVEGLYAYETMKKQLGLDHSLVDKLNQPVSDLIGSATNISAVIGLSSPLAGIKNLMIQIPRSFAVYGARNTLRGIRKAMKAMSDPKEMIKAIERGETGYGQKELLFGADKKIKWWFENINLMEKTENFNRIMTAEAGRMHFSELVNVFRGEKSLFHPKGKPAEIERMFKDIFRLTDKEMQFLKTEKDLYNSSKYEDILNYVGFSAHKSSAGATGVSDLPLWMSNKYMKPLTLFQRMAYSVTIDSYKNYIKPMKNGNIAPFLKATAGHMLTGAALYGMYDKLLGTQVPVEENPALDRAISYLWRGESLGVFGEIISPYMPAGNINPLMEPVIVRNLTSGFNELKGVFTNGKPLEMALKDFGRNTLVVGAQLEKAWNNSVNPYAVNSRRISTLEKQWRKKMGKGYEQTTGGVLSERSYAYRSLKDAIMLNKSDKEIARAYYVAYNTIVSERNAGGWRTKKMVERYAEKAIMDALKHMNPLEISNESKGRLISKRDEFLNYLSGENKELALKLEKEYQYKVRMFKKIIRNYKWKNLYSV